MLALEAADARVRQIERRGLLVELELEVFRWRGLEIGHLYEHDLVVDAPEHEPVARHLALVRDARQIGRADLARRGDEAEHVDRSA